MAAVKKNESTKEGNSRSNGRGKNSTTHTQPPSKETEPQSDPCNFETLPLKTLRKYRHLYKLKVPNAYTPIAEYIGGTAGRKTYSFTHRNRVSKAQLASHCKQHFNLQPVKENDSIVDFIYAVKNRDKEFKVHFPK